MKKVFVLLLLWLVSCGKEVDPPVPVGTKITVIDATDPCSQTTKVHANLATSLQIDTIGNKVYYDIKMWWPIFSAYEEQNNDVNLIFLSKTTDVTTITLPVGVTNDAGEYFVEFILRDPNGRKFSVTVKVRWTLKNADFTWDATDYTIKCS